MAISPINVAVDIKGFQVKTIGAGDKAEDVVEIKIHAPLGFIDLGDLSRIRKSRQAYLTLETLQGELDFTTRKEAAKSEGKVLPGQLPLPASSFTLLLRTMPLTQAEIAQAEERLISLMELPDVDELRARMQEMPLEVLALDDAARAEVIKSEFAALGAVIEIIAHAEPAVESGPSLFSVILLTIPTDEDKVKELERYLKKLTGLKLPEVRDYLKSIPWTVVERANELDAADARIGLTSLGATVEQVAWENKAPGVAVEPAATAPLYQVILRALPSDDFGIKTTEKVLKKVHPDCTIDELRNELNSLPWTFMDQATATEASDIKAELMKAGCEVDLADCPREEAQEIVAVVEPSSEDNPDETENQEGECLDETEEGQMEGGSEEMADGLQEAE